MKKNVEEKNYITPRGLKKLQEELDQLVRIERPQVTKTVTWAAGNGDRSENADYIYGKKRMREIDSRVRFLVGRLKNILIIEPAAVKTTSVQFGATVLLCDENGNNKTIAIVGQDEVNLELGLISWKSPIGKALLGKQQGDVVKVETPKGPVEYEIIELSYKDLP